MAKQQWERIGECGVDSGQLMVCDPCYIESQWAAGEEYTPNKVCRDTKTNTLWSYWTTNRKDVKKFPGTWETPIPELDNKTPNQLVSEGRFVEEQLDKPSGKFSYNGCCQLTCDDEKHAGQLMFQRGHAGAGVVFESGYGDGCYPVFARRNKEGRIVEVLIKMGDVRG